MNIYGWLLTIAGAVIAAGTLVKNAIVVSQFITFLANLQPTLVQINFALDAISKSAAKAESLATDADAKAKEAVRIASEMALKMSTHLCKQDETLGEILTHVKKAEEPAKQ